MAKYKRKWVSREEIEEYKKKNGMEGLYEEDFEDLCTPLTDEEAEEMRWRIDPELNRTNTGDSEEYDDLESDSYESEDRDDEYEQDDDYYDDYDDENGI